MKKLKRIDPEERTIQARRLAARGTEFMRQAQFERALPLLARAHRLVPGDKNAAINLGGALIMTKRYEEAIPILERVCDVDSDNLTVWMNLGAAYLGDLESSTDEQQILAIDAFERAIEIDPIAPSVHYDLGLIHRHRGESEQAIQRFHQAVQANPHDQDARRAWQRLQNEAKD